MGSQKITGCPCILFFSPCSQAEDQLHRCPWAIACPGLWRDVASQGAGGPAAGPPAALPAALCAPWSAGGVDRPQPCILGCHCVRHFLFKNENGFIPYKSNMPRYTHVRHRGVEKCVEWRTTKSRVAVISRGQRYRRKEQGMRFPVLGTCSSLS